MCEPQAVDSTLLLDDLKMPRSFLVKKLQSAKKPNYSRLDFKTEGIPAGPNEELPLWNDIHHTCPPPSRAVQSPWPLSSSSSLLPSLRMDRAGQRRERRRPHSPSSSSFLTSGLPHSSVLGRHGTSERYSGTLTDPYTRECFRTPKPLSDVCRTQESHLTHNLDKLFYAQDHRTPEERGKETQLPSTIPPSILPSFPLLALLPNPASCGISTDRFECFDCHKGYSVCSCLAKHRHFHRDWQSHKYFSCKYCEKEYASLGALKMHIRTHTLPCICKLCGKAFSRPWLLQGHIRTHTGEKPFSCLHCSRAFADRSNLRAHLQTHTDIKKYQCTSCSKTFSRISLLVKHQEAGCCLLP